MPSIARRLLWVLVLAVLSAGEARAAGFLFEVRQLTAVAPPFSRNIYLCPLCTEADFATVVAPAGFEKAPGKVFLPTEATANLPVPPPGVAPSLDLVAAIPGDDFTFIAELLTAEILGFHGTFGALARAQVERDTVFRYAAGEVVHYVTDTEGYDYVLQAFAISLLPSFDLEVVGGLAALGGLPAGWTYSSEQLTEELVVASNGLASVFAQGQLATWQRIASIPEPGTVLLLGSGVLALALRRRVASAAGGARPER